MEYGSFDAAKTEDDQLQPSMHGYQKLTLDAITSCNCAENVFVTAPKQCSSFIWRSIICRHLNVWSSVFFKYQRRVSEHLMNMY